MRCDDRQCKKQVVMVAVDPNGEIKARTCSQHASVLASDDWFDEWEWFVLPPNQTNAVSASI